jgi:hypothetical protein
MAVSGASVLGDHGGECVMRLFVHRGRAGNKFADVRKDYLGEYLSGALATWSRMPPH